MKLTRLLFYNSTPSHALRLLRSSPHVKSVSVESRIVGRKLLSFENPFIKGAAPHGHGSELKLVTQVLNANELWNKGIRGSKVKIAVFDTGIPADYAYASHVSERTDWTNERSKEKDGVSHGTFVVSVIAGTNLRCPGLAPDAEIHLYRVFTDKQVSYTSWFLDAFNHALARGIDILNLSIGGPDFTDEPFVEKVKELTASGVIFISAIGNDGPLYGTLNNPGDQADVIGVGAINWEGEVARFSARGMTTWELKTGGYGRVKPDVVTYGVGVLGSDPQGNCRSMSGTSVAAPVTTGVVALLTRFNMFEQGQGKIDLLRSYEYLMANEPTVSLSPPYLDQSDCPYQWPYCSQPLYHSGMPTLVNVTVVNGLGVSGEVVGKATWHPDPETRQHLLVSATHAGRLGSWSGYLAVAISVGPEAKAFKGIASGYIRLEVGSNGTLGERTSLVYFPIRIKIIPTPSRTKRILFDVYHSLQYPPRYIPRDNLRLKSDPLDWTGDHPHTNFRGLYHKLRAEGYFIEILTTPWLCFDARLYSTLLLIDPEAGFDPQESTKLQYDVNRLGLNLLVVTDCDKILEGTLQVGQNWLNFASGVALNYFPPQGHVFVVNDFVDQGLDVLERRAPVVPSQAILGILPPPRKYSGSVAVFGDSSCMDDTHSVAGDCFWLLKQILIAILPSTTPTASSSAPSPSGGNHQGGSASAHRFTTDPRWTPASTWLSTREGGVVDRQKPQRGSDDGAANLSTFPHVVEQQGNNNNRNAGLPTCTVHDWLKPQRNSNQTTIVISTQRRNGMGRHLLKAPPPHRANDLIADWLEYHLPDYDHQDYHQQNQYLPDNNSNRIVNWLRSRLLVQLFVKLLLRVQYVVKHSGKSVVMWTGILLLFALFYWKFRRRGVRTVLALPRLINY